MPKKWVHCLIHSVFSIPGAGSGAFGTGVSAVAWSSFLSCGRKGMGGGLFLNAGAVYMKGFLRVRLCTWYLLFVCEWLCFLTASHFSFQGLHDQKNLAAESGLGSFSVCFFGSFVLQDWKCFLFSWISALAVINKPQSWAFWISTDICNWLREESPCSPPFWFEMCLFPNNSSRVILWELCDKLLVLF